MISVHYNFDLGQWREVWPSGLEYSHWLCKFRVLDWKINGFKKYYLSWCGQWFLQHCLSYKAKLSKCSTYVHPPWWIYVLSKGKRLVQCSLKQNFDNPWPITFWPIKSNYQPLIVFLIQFIPYLLPLITYELISSLYFVLQKLSENFQDTEIDSYLALLKKSPPILGDRFWLPFIQPDPTDLLGWVHSESGEKRNFTWRKGQVKHWDKS